MIQNVSTAIPMPTAISMAENIMLMNALFSRSAANCFVDVPATSPTFNSELIAVVAAAIHCFVERP